MKHLYRFWLIVILSCFCGVKHSSASGVNKDSVYSLIACEVAYVLDQLNYGTPQSCVVEPAVTTLHYNFLLTGGMNCLLYTSDAADE